MESITKGNCGDFVNRLFMLGFSSSSLFTDSVDSDVWCLRDGPITASRFDVVPDQILVWIRESLHPSC